MLKNLGRDSGQDVPPLSQHRSSENLSIYFGSRPLGADEGHVPSSSPRASLGSPVFLSWGDFCLGAEDRMGCCRLRNDVDCSRPKVDEAPFFLGTPSLSRPQIAELSGNTYPSLHTIDVDSQTEPFAPSGKTSS